MLEIVKWGHKGVSPELTQDGLLSISLLLRSGIQAQRRLRGHSHYLHALKGRLQSQGTAVWSWLFILNINGLFLNFFIIIIIILVIFLGKRGFKNEQVYTDGYLRLQTAIKNHTYSLFGP